ncbi:hypothetical protein EXA18_16050 [Vibrio cincinnatiensis]|nr:hypothetical protein [Vibrio cincinnatiensis]
MFVLICCKKYAYNKQFKRDSPRLAFWVWVWVWVWVWFSVYGVQIGYRGRVAHPLIGRYVTVEKKTTMY